MSTWVCGLGTIPTIKTNADCIRNMSDNEMAKLISQIAGCPLRAMEEPPLGKCVKNCKARDCWLKWLKQEAKSKK